FVRLFSFPEIEYIDVIVMCLILAAAVSFIFSKYDRLMTISLIWLFSSVFYLYCENKWPSDFTMTLLFSVLAGLGLDEMFLSTVYDPELALKESVKNKPVAIETDAAEDQTVKEAPAEAQVSEAEVSKEASINDRVQEAEAVKEQDNSEKIKAEEASENTEAEEVKEEEEVKEVKEVKLFDNPLPVPKPHVRKEISYSFEPDESMMKFDLDISENDDFDI
ncbi:MAG: cell envelope integrity protein TolA, partial [Lachnospiraceae bacterium]|nr:cell envelope integrity protein TolA [Lachnospiraceae bacterium]